MTETMRLVVPITYDAVVVPRGARLPRTMPFRAEIPIDLPVVARSEVRVGVDCMCGPGVGPVTYLTHGDGLYLPMVRDKVARVSVVSSKVALQALVDGLDLSGTYDGRGWVPNPFIHLSRHTGRAEAGPIDEAFLRSIESNGFAEAVATAHRLASEFLVVDDGRILRASRGPVWAVYGMNATFELHPNFDREHAPGEFLFGPTRLDDARRFADEGRQHEETFGYLDVHEPEAVKDYDAWMTVIGMYDTVSLDWLIGTSDNLPNLSERMFAHYRTIRGAASVDAFVQCAELPIAPGTPAPTPSQLVEAVDDLRAFHAEVAGLVKEMKPNWRSDLSKRLPFEGRMLARKWDEFERDRIVDEPAPEIGLHP